MPATTPRLLLLPFVSALLLTGCTTLKRTAVNQLGDALAAGGTTFAADDDPQLIAAAAPFSLKLMESLLAETPHHRGLLLATASGFTQYAYAFVQQEADEIAPRDFAAAAVRHARARRLYLRARDYGLRGLALSQPGLTAELRSNPRAALARLTRADVPLLYWTAAAWGAAISLGKDNADLIGDLPCVEALIDRAAALDETFGEGAVPAFLIAYELSRPGEGDPLARARRAFERAVTLSQGKQAGPFVTFAESVAVPRQLRAEFDTALQRALAIDADAEPASRLLNLVMQRRARWLLARRDELFVP